MQRGATTFIAHQQHYIRPSYGLTSVSQYQNTSHLFKDLCIKQMTILSIDGNITIITSLHYHQYHIIIS